MNDETIRLILDLANSAKSTQDLVDKLQQLKVVTTTAGNSYTVLEQETKEYEVLERQVVATTSQVVQATAAEADAFTRLSFATDTATVSTARLAGQVGHNSPFGRGLLQTSFAVQDFTSQLGTRGLAGALGAVQNNIPVILTGLGLGAGLAGVVSIVSVGVGLLVSNWDKLSDLWTGGETEKEAERMKALAEATEAAAKAGEALLKTHTPQQKAGTEALKRATDAFGGEDVLQETMKQMVRERGSFGADLDRQYAKNLLTNVNSGDMKSQEYLRSLMAGREGPIAQVLAGGKTPQEEMEINKRANARQAKEADDAREKADKARKDREDEKTKNKQDAERDAEHWQQKFDADDARSIEQRNRENAQLDAKMRQALPAMKREEQERKGARQIQQEAAAQGLDLNPAQALQVWKQRQAELKRLETETFSVMLGNQAEMSQQIQQLRMFLGQAKQVNQRNRSAQTNGLW